MWRYRLMEGPIPRAGGRRVQKSPGTAIKKDEIFKSGNLNLKSAGTSFASKKGGEMAWKWQ